MINLILKGASILVGLSSLATFIIGYRQSKITGKFNQWIFSAAFSNMWLGATLYALSYYMP